MVGFLATSFPCIKRWLLFWETAENNMLAGDL